MLVGENMKSFHASIKTLKHIEIMYGDVLERKRSFLDSESMHGL